MRCDNCRNAGICKFEDNVRAFEKSLTDQITKIRSINAPDIIDVNIFCHKYSKKWTKQDGFNPKTKKLS